MIQIDNVRFRNWYLTFASKIGWDLKWLSHEICRLLDNVTYVICSWVILKYLVAQNCLRCIIIWKVIGEKPSPTLDSYTHICLQKNVAMAGERSLNCSKVTRLLSNLIRNEVPRREGMIFSMLNQLKSSGLLCSVTISALRDLPKMERRVLWKPGKWLGKKEKSKT